MQIEYHNGTRLLCVIGDPIGHSLSPLLHNTMLRELHEDALYLAVPVPLLQPPGVISSSMGWEKKMP